MEESQKSLSVDTPYKYKELKVYSSTEWLVENRKKYRQVFDRYEITYIYAELTLYNKKFDVENWEVNVEMKCFELKKNKRKVCHLKIRKDISKFDPVVYIREGWGNKKLGAFWKEGTYYWEAWINGEKVANKYFYIEDAGPNYDEYPNPYLALRSVRLYEGLFDDVIEGERKYYKAFDAEESRYIYAEVALQNLIVHTNWHCEVFFKFYNQARELKGQVVKLVNVRLEDEDFVVTAGWGSNSKGSWRPGHYEVEVIFMDKLIAIIPFEVSEEFVTGDVDAIIQDDNILSYIEHGQIKEQSFDAVMDNLNNLIGLKNIKEQVMDHAKYLQFLQLRKEHGFKENDQINIHSVFTGNPGTGKTTVAKMMGLVYKKMGLLKKGHVHEVDRVDLVGEYIGQTAPKVKEAIEKAEGGVLFIDEAYSLARANDDSKDFGREVIEILVKEMSNPNSNFAVIVAGYPKEMDHFITSNPGLKSRFKHFYHFPDYLPQELSEIATYAAKDMEVDFQTDARTRIDELIIEAFRNRDQTFGNARFVYDLIEKSKINLGLRTMNSNDPSSQDLQTIVLEDVNKISIKKSTVLPNIPIDYVLLEQAKEELYKLVGIDKVKKQILDLVNVVQFYRENGKAVLNKFYLHTIFVGNPGTGKTTVARILTKIYKSLGVLERGHMIETDRQGLIAGFVGQTAIKTTEVIDKAIGGVLFIDEAYGLNSSRGGNDFGNEAIQTILKRMEDQRGEFFVFAAGYPDNMDAFLKANPGLSSRFDKILRFDDYNPEELYQIAVQMLEDEELKLSPKAVVALEEHLNKLYEQRDRYFGNARTIRSFITNLVKQQNLRIASHQDNKGYDPNMIVLEDVIKTSESIADSKIKRSHIGYGR